jgi:hypothetical protein
MRRLWATLLVAVFSFAFIPPAMFVPAGDEKLPPCCRKDGKHHCAAAQSKGSSSGPSFQARCPLFSNGQTLPSIPRAEAPILGHAFTAGVTNSNTSRPQTEKLGAAPFDRSGQKRGPPSLS